MRNNGVKQIYCPTNGWFTEKTIKDLRALFEEPQLDLFAAELSLDGMPAFHNEFRVNKKSFQKSMETYDALGEYQKEEPRLQIHSISTCTGENIDEIKALSTFLYERCPPDVPPQHRDDSGRTETRDTRRPGPRPLHRADRIRSAPLE